MAEKKEAVFVICEYNPLHFGHEYQLRLLKERYNTVICVMSGDAVQRGEAAVYPKHARAEAAVRCGADAVFELPFPYSCMAAPDFAFAGVYAASSLGCADLAFGAEADGDFIRAAAEVISDRDAIAEVRARNKNIPYPKAVCRVIAQKLGEKAAENAVLPNNILGMEYIRASKELSSDMNFEIIKRNPDYKSSSEIRGSGDMLSHIPPAAAAVFEKYRRRDMKNLSSALLASCRMLSPESDVYGLTCGDVMRLKSAALDCGDFYGAVEAAVSPTMTRARARRGMLCALLGITRADSALRPKYIRLLALNDAGAEYISKHKKSFSLPIVSKPSHIRALGAEAVSQYQRALTAESVLALAEEDCGAFDPIHRKSIMTNLT